MDREQFKRAWHLHRKLQRIYYEQAKNKSESLSSQSNTISRELEVFSFDDIWNIVDKCWKDYPQHYQIHLSKRMSTPKSVLRNSFNYLKCKPGQVSLWDDVTLLHKRISNRALLWNSQSLISEDMGDDLIYWIPNNRNDTLDNKNITRGYGYPEYFEAAK